MKDRDNQNSFLGNGANFWRIQLNKLNSREENLLLKGSVAAMNNGNLMTQQMQERVIRTMAILKEKLE